MAGHELVAVLAVEVARVGGGGHLQPPDGHQAAGRARVHLVLRVSVKIRQLEVADNIFLRQHIF